MLISSSAEVRRKERQGKGINKGASTQANQPRSPTQNALTTLRSQNGQDCHRRWLWQSVRPFLPNQPLVVSADRMPDVAQEILDGLVARQRHEILLLSRKVRPQCHAVCPAPDSLRTPRPTVLLLQAWLGSRPTTTTQPNSPRFCTELTPFSPSSSRTQTREARRKRT